jgi:hypothetical protein
VPVPPDCGWLEPLPPETLPLDGVVGAGADGVGDDAGGVGDDTGGVTLGGGALLAGDVVLGVEVELGAVVELGVVAAGAVVVDVAAELPLAVLILALGLGLDLDRSLMARGLGTGATGAIVTVGSLALATDVTCDELPGWFLPWRPRTNAAAKAATSAADARTRTPRRRDTEVTTAWRRAPCVLAAAASGVARGPRLAVDAAIAAAGTTAVAPAAITPAATAPARVGAPFAGPAVAGSAAGAGLEEPCPFSTSILRFPAAPGCPRRSARR